MTTSLPAAIDSARDDLASYADPSAASLGVFAQSDAALVLLTEDLSVTKRRVPGKTIRVSTHTVAHDEVIETALERETVEVDRVSVNRFVDTMPEPRIEGGTTILSIVEERLVTVKRLFVVEEVHITRRRQVDTVRTPVTLRRQHARVETLDAQGEPIEPSRPSDQQKPPTA